MTCFHNIFYFQFKNSCQEPRNQSLEVLNFLKVTDLFELQHKNALKTKSGTRNH